MIHFPLPVGSPNCWMKEGLEFLLPLVKGGSSGSVLNVLKVFSATIPAALSAL